MQPDVAEFKYDQQVKVKRSDGTIESDWVFKGMNVGTGKIFVEKIVGEKILTKQCTLEALRGIQ